MAESFLLPHSLKMIGPRVSKEFFCNTSQYISIITFRKISCLLAFPVTDFPMHIVFPIKTKKFYDSKSLLFTQAGSWDSRSSACVDRERRGHQRTDLTIELVQMHWQQFQVRLRMIWGAQFSEYGEIMGAQPAGRTESQDREVAMALAGELSSQFSSVSWGNQGKRCFIWICQCGESRSHLFHEPVNAPVHCRLSRYQVSA